MNKNKIIRMGLIIAIAGGVGIIPLTKLTNAVQEQDNEIKVMDYKSSENIIQNNYEIEQYENINAQGWINENEILTLSKGTPVEGCDSMSYYCSIYNLNTKESRDFKNANIGDILGISQDGKYVLYNEPRYIPTDNQKWQEAVDSGDLTYKKVKILNLESNQINDLETERNNSDAEFFWISTSKILINYWNHWCIKDIEGRTYCEGRLDDNVSAKISGIYDLQDDGEEVKGSFYVTRIGDNALDKIDVKTGQIENIYNLAHSQATVDKNYIIANNGWVKVSQESGNDIGEEKEESKNMQNDIEDFRRGKKYSYSILDKDGKEINKIYMRENKIASLPVISPHGSKAVYFEEEADKSLRADRDVLKSIDIKTGKTSDIARIDNLKNGTLNEVTDEESKDTEDNNKSIITFRSNPLWDTSGSSVLFTYEYVEKETGVSQINTYIVTFNN